MRLCIVSNEYPPVTEYFGGIGTQYGRLAPELARLGHELHVITWARQRRDVEMAVEGVHVHVLARPRAWPWRPLAWARSVDGRIRELGPLDAVLAPEFGGQAVRYAHDQSRGPLITHLLTSLAQLLTLRPGLTWRERHGMRTRISLAVERSQTTHSAALLAPGRAVLDWARELWDLPDVNTQIVPLTIDVDAVREAARTGQLPEGFPATGPTVTLASRLDGHKGAQHLVAAMDSVWETRPDAQLVFVGRDARWKGGWMSDHLRELAGARVDRVHVLGAQPTERYFAAVAASDVVAIPSLWESFCLAAVEAMALGRPVIGTRDNGFSEFIVDGENGLLVGRGSVPELGAAVARLLEAPDLRARLGDAAARTAELHDARRVAPRYADALAGLTRG